MIIDCISDLHGHYPELKGGDMLIIAGDLTAHDSPGQTADFILWAMDKAKNQYKKVIYIAGNHDNFIQETCKRIRIEETHEHPSLAYLSDSGTEFEGLKIWGSPWTLEFVGMNPKCKAFTVKTEMELAEKMANIPDKVDIMITHSPMYGILDKTTDSGHCGSHYLRSRLAEINPKLWVCGHIHEQGGKIYDTCVTKVVNASIVDENYEPINQPVRIEL